MFSPRISETMFRILIGYVIPLKIPLLHRSLILTLPSSYLSSIEPFAAQKRAELQAQITFQWKHCIQSSASSSLTTMIVSFWAPPQTTGSLAKLSWMISKGNQKNSHSPCSYRLISLANSIYKVYALHDPTTPFPFHRSPPSATPIWFPCPSLSFHSSFSPPPSYRNF